MYKLIMKWFNIDDLSCQATINSIYVSISSVAEMLKYGYICSESDVHKEVEIESVFSFYFLFVVIPLVILKVKVDSLS